jgi:hypothetical protein
MDSGKRTFFSGRGSRRILVMALVFSLAIPLTSMISSLPVAYAKTSPTVSGTGTFTDIAVTILSIQMVGSNEVIKDAGLGKVTGTLSGTYAFTATITIQPSGIATYSAIDACECTVAGNTGGLLFSEQGTGNVITGAFLSKATITKSSNGLKGDTGTAILKGIQDPVTNLTTGTYTITLSLQSNTQVTDEYAPIQGSNSVTVPASDNAPKSLAPSPAHTEASQTNSAGAGASHSTANHGAHVTSHSETKHSTITSSPSKPATPTSNAHAKSSPHHRSP